MTSSHLKEFLSHSFDKAMFFSKRSTILPIILASSALGHGQVRSFITSTTTYPAADAYSSSPDPNSPIRKLDTYGPAEPFTGSAITCGSGGNNAAAVVAPVAAGSSVTFDWGAWTSMHPEPHSPVMTYAHIPIKDVTPFLPVNQIYRFLSQWMRQLQGRNRQCLGEVEDGYNPTRTLHWAEENIRDGGATGHGLWTVKMPSTLPNGEYILRHEILGLHRSSELNGAQFYPNCAQIKITGGGNVPLPSGIALPGAYQPTDPGIYLQLYTITPSNSTYIIPGGPVLYGPDASGTSSNSASPLSTTSKASSTSTTSKASTTSSTTSPSSSVTGGLPKWSQCGGNASYTGSTVCAAGSICTVVNPYYSQCL
ncbi:carbohydrate-binding module family 1 protein [Serendipita vermifera MAFF 305830]|uniref:lytic cellulose monooxygenase (C4-dehydrogenating) n=1 Tax=Serendipita vermifera MAFF 305830 TaxID=933852 RepID=A0A0C3ANR6_SERVB|nr:carbohydrate-binding module family 1 protein [Serendipita vermifera MAFF 305830]